SSVPSMVRSSQRASSSVTTSIPSARASAAVRAEVGTPVIRRPSCRTRSPRSRTIQAAVDPVPSPTRIPLSTNSTAFFAATYFAISTGDRFAGIDFSVSGTVPVIERLAARREGQMVRMSPILRACAMICSGHGGGRGMLVFDADTTRFLDDIYLGADFARRRRANFDALDPRPGERILDLGCGPGHL